VGPYSDSALIVEESVNELNKVAANRILNKETGLRKPITALEFVAVSLKGLSEFAQLVSGKGEALVRILVGSREGRFLPNFI
jgi:hypothetical protein